MPVLVREKRCTLRGLSDVRAADIQVMDAWEPDSQSTGFWMRSLVGIELDGGFRPKGCKQTKFLQWQGDIPLPIAGRVLARTEVSFGLLQNEPPQTEPVTDPKGLLRVPK